ncbi:MAG TPA: sulfatase-like hydrolase/transferase, partial [Candidatus Binatia bacterium]
MRPWLTVAVYLWVLQLIADFAINDPEPIFDRLADCGAILWTLIFWIAAAVVLFWLIVPVVGRARLIDLNELGAKGLLVAISALAFVRWLFNWANLLGNRDIVSFALVLLCLGLGVWVWRRRKRQGGHELNLPSLDEGWSYFALPILTVISIVLTITVGRHLTLLYANRLGFDHAYASQSQERNPRRSPNVVLIVADALRAQSMSLYGYGRKTTPFLEQFAERSGVYTQMYTNSTSTRPSLTSILSGKHPFSHGRLTKFLPPYDKP